MAFISARAAADKVACLRSAISPPVGSSSRRISRPTVVLPQPDSPTSPSVSPGIDVEADILDRAHRAARAAQPAAHLEMLGQIAHRQQRRRRSWRTVCVEPAPAAAQASLPSAISAVAVAARQAAGVGRSNAAARCRRSRCWNGQRGAKRQPGGGVGAIGRQAFDGFELAAARPVEPRHRAQQPHRIGMARAVEHVVGVALFDQPRGIHHDDAVGVARDHAEIMRDDDQRDIELARQVLHQFEDLRLDGDVERGGRLVGDDELRIAGEPDRDHHALAHAAGELVRILFEPPRRDRGCRRGRSSSMARARACRVGHAEMDGAAAR